MLVVSCLPDSSWVECNKGKNREYSLKHQEYVLAIKVEYFCILSA